MRGSARRSIPGALLATVLAGTCLGVTGCVQDGQAREASGAVIDSQEQGCGYESPMPWLVRNDLPIPVTVRPFDIDPYDWMGDANPGRLEGKVLQPGTQEVVVLANNCSANGAPFGLRFEQEWNGGTSEITRPSFDKEYLCMSGPFPVVCGVPLATRVRVGWGYRGGPDDANFGCLKSGSTARFTYHKWGDDGSEQVWNGHGQLTGCGGFRLVEGPPPE